MSFEKAIEVSLAAALSDDQALLADLHGAFLTGANGHLCDMREAASNEDWRDAALRLNGLAASFGAVALMNVASRAAKGERGDDAILAALAAEIAQLS